MKFFISSTFKDSLKDEAWDDHKKGWSYPWLKTNWVAIKSLETGGATIPTDKYRVDNKEGIIFWLEAGQPRNISLEVESKKSFLGIRRKGVLFIALTTLILSLMYGAYSHKRTYHDGEDTTILMENIDSLIGISLEKDSTLSVLSLENDTLLNKLQLFQSDSSSSILVGSITDLEHQLATVTREKRDQRNSYRSQLRAKGSEISSLNTRIETLTATTPPPQPDFTGFKAQIMCETQTSREYYNKIKDICSEVSIVPTNLGVKSPEGKSGTICYGTTGKKAAEYLKEKLVNIGIIVQIQACSSSNANRINIYID